MYKVLLVFKDENIAEKIKRMNIWGEIRNLKYRRSQKTVRRLMMRLKNSTMIWQSCKRILTEWTDFSFEGTSEVKGCVLAWCFSAVSRILKTQDRV